MNVVSTYPIIVVSRSNIFFYYYYFFSTTSDFSSLKIFHQFFWYPKTSRPRPLDKRLVAMAWAPHPPYKPPNVQCEVTNRFGPRKRVPLLRLCYDADMKELHIPKIEALPEKLFPNAVAQVAVESCVQLQLDIPLDIPQNILLGQE